jgi:hypothetical protein
MVLTDDLQAIAAAEWASEVGIESVYVLHDTEPTGAVSPNRSPPPAPDAAFGCSVGAEAHHRS